MKRKVLSLLVITFFSILLYGCKDSSSVPENPQVILGSVETIAAVTTAMESVRVETQNTMVTTPQPVTTITEVTTTLTTTTTTTTILTTTVTTTVETTTVLESTVETSPIIIETVVTTVVPQVTPIIQNSGVIKELPPSILAYVNSQKQAYPGLHIGCGIYSLDGKSGFEYNASEEINGGCTVKAPYACYVLETCEEELTNLWTTKIQYQSWMRNDGSGYIKNAPVGTEYSVGYLMNPLLKVSDNTGYNILLSRYNLTGYQAFLNKIGGQNLYGSAYGRASVKQRLNEWVEISRYINTGSAYSQVLKTNLTGKRTWNPNIGAMQVDPDGSQYCYLVEWMRHDHEFQHKSGWSWGDYSSAGDCAIIDNQYLIIIMTSDPATGLSRTDVLRGFGYAVEEYVDSVGGATNLFS